MTGPTAHTAPRAAFAVVTVMEVWDPAAQTWAEAWRRQGPAVQLVVVDRSPDGTLAGVAPGDVQVVEGHRGTLSMALNVGLEAVQAPRVLFQRRPRIPPDDFAQALSEVEAAEDAPLLGPGAPPAGLARNALDTLMLHLVPADAILQAPGRWSTVPDAFWVLFPTEALRTMGGLEAAEANFELAVQEACLRLGRRSKPVQLPHIGWSVERVSTRALSEGIRNLTAARIRRLARRPDTVLESGWSLASRTAVRAALSRDPLGSDRQRILEQLGDVDMQPMARMPEWAPVARDQLRRMLVGLRQQQQRWVLQGLLDGIESCNAEGIPELLGRHPIRLCEGSTVLLPVEREDAVALRTAVAAVFRGGVSEPCTLAVVAGPNTSGRLRSRLGREWHSLELMAVLSGSELLLQPTSLTAPRAIRMLTPCSGWVPFRRLQGEAWAMHARVTGTPAVPVPNLSLPAFELSRPVRLLAWPEWNDPTALDQLVHNLLLPLASRRDVTICLRVDPTRDGALHDLQRRLEDQIESVLPEHAALEVLLLADPMDTTTARRLGLAIHAWVGSTPDPAFTRAVGAPVHARADPILAAWDNLSGQGLDWDAPTQ